LQDSGLDSNFDQNFESDSSPHSSPQVHGLELANTENIAIDEMLASTKKPKATPLMEKFYNSIEYFEEVVQVDADSIPGSSEETKADRRDHQTKFYWRGHCKLPHTTAEVTGIITDKMGTSSNFSRHVKKFHLSEYEKWQQPLKIKPAVAVGPGQLSIAQAFQ